MPRRIIRNIKKIKLFNYLVIALIIIALVVGVMTAKGKRATASKQIEATTNVEIEVYIKGATVTSKEPIFKKGEETFITIRNVPYTKLKIKDVKSNRRKAMLPTAGANKYVVVNDEAAPNQYDYLIKIIDSAKITKDGDAVLGGNKVKIGLPITLEGAKYKLNGIISNISVSPEPEQTAQSHEDLDKHTKLNQDVQ